MLSSAKRLVNVLRFCNFTKEEKRKMSWKSTKVLKVKAEAFERSVNNNRGKTQLEEDLLSTKDHHFVMKSQAKYEAALMSLNLKATCVLDKLKMLQNIV